MEYGSDKKLWGRQLLMRGIYYTSIKLIKLFTIIFYFTKK